MLRTLPPLAATVLTVAAGLVHGYWSDRWAPPVETAQAAERLTAIPLVVGDWDGKDVEVKPGQAGAGIAGSVQRCYTHRATGVAVVLALVCGRPGPVSIHTPESCYTASGYDFGSRSPVKVDPAANFWTADAVRTKATEETRVRLFWGWNTGAGWSAPNDARTTFARAPVLYKLYALRELNSLAEPLAGDPGQVFLQALLPALDETLFAPGP